MKRHGEKNPVRHMVLGLGLAMVLVGCGGGSGPSGQAGSDLQSRRVKENRQGITRIVIDEAASQAATFGGTSFGAFGTYDRVVGKAYGQIDPRDPRNAVIADIQLAQRDPATGMVPYSFDFYILKPANPAGGRHKVFFEPPNRGGKRSNSFAGLGSGESAADAAPAGAPYPAFLLNRGYTMVWSGWDAEPMSGTGNIRADLPMAVNADGSPITGPSYEYLVAGNATTTCQTTYYSPAPGTSATLTVREHMTDPPVVVPADGWSWNGPGSCGNTEEVALPGTNSISLAGNAPFQRGWIYELTYTAINPYVAGVGMAAMRDFVTFLREDKQDSEGNANPLDAKVGTVSTWALSQPARLMNDFVWLGFNESLRGRPVFDGVFNWIGGGNGLGINYRFAQVGRTERNRQNHIAQTEGTFPFSYTTSRDPLTGKVDGRNVRCTASRTCPKIMNVYSANELWVKSGSLLTTDPATGADLQEVANVRNYLIASSQHGNASNIATPTTCTQFGSQVDPEPVLRALWVALDAWVEKKTPPPPSVNPSLAAGTGALVPLNGPHQDLGIGAIGAAAIGYPELPGTINLFSGLVTVRNLWDFGPRFDQGILDQVPGLPTGKLYATVVPKVDAHGNDVGGIRTPDVTAPLGTSSGWALRSAAFAGKADGTDGCEAAGQFVPFALNDAMKVAGDPRPSLQALYGDKGGFVAARIAAAQALQASGLLLPADADNYRIKAERVFRTVPNPNYPQAYVYSW